MITKTLHAYVFSPLTCLASFSELTTMGQVIIETYAFPAIRVVAEPKQLLCGFPFTLSFTLLVYLIRLIWFDSRGVFLILTLGTGSK